MRGLLFKELGHRRLTCTPFVTRLTNLLLELLWSNYDGVEFLKSASKHNWISYCDNSTLYIWNFLSFSVTWAITELQSFILTSSALFTIFNTCKSYTPFPPACEHIWKWSLNSLRNILSELRDLYNNSSKETVFIRVSKSNRPFYSCLFSNHPLKGSEAAGDLCSSVLIQT